MVWTIRLPTTAVQEIHPVGQTVIISGFRFVSRHFDELIIAKKKILVHFQLYKHIANRDDSS
jgi:hypothetical protein